MKHVSGEIASSTMFLHLLSFISGENDQKKKIAMTAPVSVFIEICSGPTSENTFTMAFYLPDAFQKDTPNPTNDLVSFEQRPEFKAFVR